MKAVRCRVRGVFNMECLRLLDHPSGVLLHDTVGDSSLTEGPKQFVFHGIRDTNLVVTIPGYNIELTAGDD